ncbi:AbrB/MazE/SpoVT family DNA-binding domain-containing protein [Kyrpidia tusciae]|uniref:Transcriptional regulator, AbrB family n=1 Tax=Kyrpidia tusciae (strain DSM 2912 / NBRC 15312 / T2) TaxID=562970 RepID=D5WWM0_KYRT2|nr:AbrB/MazE/SpoVT family DNA-binding domain-containing protein [Kyrpidia tusciae]ADG07785.1 transcriptional regulator, AbrB family [Kyrpidia tusciae DSM 2912]
MRQSKVTSHGQVTIPKSIRGAFGLEEGDDVIFERVPEGILLRSKKVRLVDPDDTLSPEDQEVVQRGREQIQLGECVEWNDLRKELEE